MFIFLVASLNRLQNIFEHLLIKSNKENRVYINLFSYTEIKIKALVLFYLNVLLQVYAVDFNYFLQTILNKFFHGLVVYHMCDLIFVMYIFVYLFTLCLIMPASDLIFY